MGFLARPPLNPRHTRTASKFGAVFGQGHQHSRNASRWPKAVQQACKAVVGSPIAIGTSDAEHFGRITLQERSTLGGGALR